MASHVIDSAIFRDIYGTDELRRVFSDENLLQCWLDIEAAERRTVGRAFGTVGAEKIGFFFSC